MDDLSKQVQDYILCGGSYGSTGNRVALQQKNKGGRIRYILSRISIPYEKLKRYYPILENHVCLMSIMQIRRWFMLLKPSVAKMAKSEIDFNRKVDNAKANEMNAMLKNIGLL